MADQVVGITPGVGINVDVTEILVGGKLVERQRINNADPINPAALQSVTAPGIAGLFAAAVQGVPGGVALSVVLPGSPAQDATVAAVTTKLGSPAQDATVAAITAKLPSSPALDATVAAITAKLPTAPALDATVAAITAKLPTSPALDGTDATGVVVPAGAVGIRGWLSSIYNRLSGTLTTSVSNFPATQPVSGTVGVSNFPATQPISGSVAVSTLPGSPAQDGTDATGVVVPAGAVGIRGWLSGIYRALTGTLNIGSGTVLTILTPTSPTAVTSIKTSAGRAVKLVNASTSAQNVTISLFNESTTVGAAATLIYSAILGASQVIALDILVPNGLSYSLSAAPLANIIVVSS